MILKFKTLKKVLIIKDYKILKKLRQNSYKQNFKHYKLIENDYKKF